MLSLKWPSDWPTPPPRMLARELGYRTFVSRMLVRQVAKRILHVDTTIRLPNGYQMLLPASSSTATEVYLTRCNVDWGSEALLLKHLRPGLDFLDIGANIGYYSLYVAHGVRHVYAFEPDPRNLRWLEQNSARAPNITVIPAAVFSHSGQISLVPAADPARTSVAEPYGESSSITVTATTIDEFTRAGGVNVSGIKIDVEGRDLDVLLGGERVLSRDRPVVLTEFNQGDEDRLLAYAERLGYSIFGFVRPHEAPGFRGNNQPRFASLPEAPFRYRYKMLFLVPDHLVDEFAARVDGP